MPQVVSTREGSTLCRKPTRFPFGFSFLWESFSKLKHADRALSISEQIIPTRPFQGCFLIYSGEQDNLKTPGQSRPEFLSEGFPK